MKATFFERLGSYVLDLTIVSIILFAIGLGFENKTTENAKLLEELDNKLMANTITSEEYFKEYSNITYDIQKETVLESGISIAITIAYFVIFQYMNKGQTIGKKLLKIKVVDKTTKKPITIAKGFLRTVLIQNLLSGVLSILFLYIINKNSYFLSYGIVTFIELTFSLISVILILYKKDGRGLHDMMTNTIVIKESR